MTFNLTDHWHAARFAVEWPRGSVVLLRIKWDRGVTLSYVYLFSQFFTPSLAEEHPEAEYMLIEVPKETSEHHTTLG